jgi:hypothetical protein
VEKSGFLAASEALLLEWWNDFGLRQLEEKSKRVYRATIAHKLIELYWRWGDNGTAFRWALHTQADDMLGKHGTGGGVGKHLLRATFGMSESALEELNRIAEECLKEVEEEWGNDWSQPAGFPEEVVRRFALSEGTGTQVLAKAASFREFPLSQAYFQALLSHVHSGKPAKGKEKGKGDVLENLASYLLTLLPGCVSRRNLLDEDLASESDIVVRNLNQVTNLTAELLGRHFLVECKNWEKRVGVRDVGYFLYRMRLTHARFGIIFSRSGISGGDEGKAARALIRRAFHEDGSDHDLATLAQGKGSFWWMLLEKIEKLRFGRPRGHDRQGELRRIKGIGPRRAYDLAQADITTLAALASADTRGVADALRGVTVKMVEAWQKEASALIGATTEVM